MEGTHVITMENKNVRLTLCLPGLETEELQDSWSQVDVAKFREAGS